MISGCVPKFLEAIKTEMDRTVVMQAVDSIQVSGESLGVVCGHMLFIDTQILFSC